MEYWLTYLDPYWINFCKYEFKGDRSTMCNWFMDILEQFKNITKFNYNDSVLHLWTTALYINLFFLKLNIKEQAQSEFLVFV